ncbi:MAG: hypothetical protein KAI66_05720 [Lentisphaeria bacterium]|nr:hypothetical protein [Lentisphaeria bacterium]
MIRLLSLLILFALLGARTAYTDNAFSVKLDFKNAHLRELHFGCAADATNGFDRTLDSPGPPPGIETAYIGFIPGDKTPSLLNRDYRPVQKEQKWYLLVKPHPGKPTVISWDQASLPSNWALTITTKDGGFNMLEKSQIDITQEQTIEIIGDLISGEVAGTADPAAQPGRKVPVDKPTVSRPEVQSESSETTEVKKRGGTILFALGAVLAIAILVAFVRGR